MSIHPPSFYRCDIPPEVMLHIFSYLDLPDLATVVQASPVLANLASDPVLHRNRLRVITPSRLQHSLYGADQHGLAFRPTIGDLVHRGVICGLGVERRWRMGLYFYSPNSVIQYENSMRLARQHASDVISVQLKRRSASPRDVLNSLHSAGVLPDVESSSLRLSRSLLPVIHQLKWSFQRDALSRTVKGFRGFTGSIIDFGVWFERTGNRFMEENERVRLAVCPDISKIIAFYEGLGRSV
ncbi:hypothetical protein L208DRAFT_1409040 [Tricholoma matsutake]|nr:hypothetical protein L208DRAFT_1409040 [Tricholoma matsutake 945]